MYPFMRFFWVLATAKGRGAMTPDDASELPMIAWPWDCDPFVELNNGRQLTLFDLGRFDLGARTGLLKLLKDKRWGLTVAGSSMQYRKRITPFQRVTLRTELLGRDERWFYIGQVFERRGEACSQGLLRTAVLAPGRGIVPTQEVADALGWSDWNRPPPAWVSAWIEAEKTRPWPPERHTDRASR